MDVCLSYGIPRGRFWEMSFEEIDEEIEVKVAMEKREMLKQLQIAYYTAVMMRAKDPEKVYREIVKHLDQKKKQMTNEEMEKEAKKLTLMFGGVIKKGGD